MNRQEALEEIEYKMRRVKNLLIEAEELAAEHGVTFQASYQFKDSYGDGHHASFANRGDGWDSSGCVIGYEDDREEPNTGWSSSSTDC